MNDGLMGLLFTVLQSLNISCHLKTRFIYEKVLTLEGRNQIHVDITDANSLPIKHLVTGPFMTIQSDTLLDLNGVY